MTRRPKAPDWPALRAAYEAGAESQTALARRAGIARSTLAARAKREGWRKGPPPGKPEPLVQPPPQTGGSVAALARRLASLAARQIGDIEARLQAPDTAAERERDARTLSALTRTVEKIDELREAQKRRRRARQTGTRTPTDDDALRADIERRLARLVEAGDAAALSGEPQPEGD